MPWQIYLQKWIALIAAVNSPPTDPAADLLALTSVAMLQRSNSAIAFKSQRKQHLHWLRRSLPPAKRERRGEKAKSSGTPKKECTAGLSIPRSKSVNSKRSTAGPSTPPRSLSFASGSRVRRARRAKEDTDAELGFLEFHQLYRRGSILPIVQTLNGRLQFFLWLWRSWPPCEDSLSHSAPTPLWISLEPHKNYHQVTSSQRLSFPYLR